MKKAPVGLSLIAIGIVHQLVGILGGLNVIAMPGGSERAPLLEILRAGVLASVEPDLLRSTFVWFILFGFVLLMLGDLARRWERVGRPLPAAFGMQILALAVLGVALLPVSGFWLCFPPGALIVKKALSAHEA